jgi:hypothetical protein
MAPVISNDKPKNATAALRCIRQQFNVQKVRLISDGLARLAFGAF